MSTSPARRFVRPLGAVSGLLVLCTVGAVVGAGAAAAAGTPVLPHPVAAGRKMPILQVTAAGTKGTPLGSMTLASVSGTTTLDAPLGVSTSGTLTVTSAAASTVVAGHGLGSAAGTTSSGTAAAPVSGGVTGAPVSAAPVVSGGSAPVAVAAVRAAAPALWVELGDSPSDGDLVFAAGHYTVAVLNAHDVFALKRLKALNPSMTVLCYKDFASVRSSDVTGVNGSVDAVDGASGVGFNEAQRSGGVSDSWFAHDASGARIAWNNYPDQFQAAVWNPAYQAAWVNDVASEVVRDGWDGVEVDNFMSTLYWYYSGSTAEQGSASATDAAIQRAELDVTDVIGPRLVAAGKRFIPSVSDGRMDLDRWDALTRFGGGFEENWTHWNKSNESDVSGYFYDWDGPFSSNPSGWRGQQEQGVSAQAVPGSTGLFLAVTSARDGDTHASVFGLASFYLSSGGVGAFEAVTRDAYTGFHLRTEQLWQIGVATGPTVESGGYFARTFTGGYVIVNPSGTRTVTVKVPAGYLDVNGNAVTTVTLPPVTGAVLHTLS